MKQYNTKARSTEAENASRVLQVYKWLLQLYTRFEIVQMGAEKWDVIPRTIDQYIKSATELIKQEFEADKEEAREKFTKQVDELYNECIKKGDRRTAANILKLQADLRGLLVQKVDVTTGGDKINHITVEIITKSLEEREKE